MNVLHISYGKNFFAPDNQERKRQQKCAEEAGTFHTVVFSHRRDGLREEQVDDHFFLYPTNSAHSLQKVIDAINIGTKIIKDSQTNDWVITAQDPFEAGFVAWRIAKATGVPFNLQEHGDFFSTSYWRRESLLNQIRFYFGRFLLKRADSVRVVAERTRTTLINAGVASDRIFILPVEVSTTRFKTAVSQTKHIPNYSTENIYLLTVGRFVKQKNLSLLVNAFADVAPQYTRAHLLIVGRGPLESELKKEVNDLQLQSRVTFIDWIDDVAGLMKAVHVYTLSSNYEGWGRVLIEAQAAGIPIVTTDVGCVGEGVLESKAVRVVPVNDINAYTKVLCSMLEELAGAREAAQAISKSQTEMHESSYARDWVAILKKTKSNTV